MFERRVKNPDINPDTLIEMFDGMRRVNLIQSGSASSEYANAHPELWKTSEIQKAKRDRIENEMLKNREE